MIMTNILPQIITPISEDACSKLNAGDMILLSGSIFCARDMAHKKFLTAIEAGENLPIDISGKTIFYAAPTPAQNGEAIGVIGPTTSNRMDIYTPQLLDFGMRAMIGKGQRTESVRKAIQKHKAIYLGAIGGVAALTKKSVISAEIVAYQDLGPEAVLRLIIKDMPLIVLIDSHGREFPAKR
ncbi:MAG: FumA C-terminus/TtdB family hydratase beta subunit [Deltaproteobacteria bacterium]